MILRIALTLSAVVSCSVARADTTLDFERDVGPIFEQHCLHCHSDNIAKGDFSLSTIAGLTENEYVVAGDPGSSHLVDLISGDEPEMPKEGEPLSDDQVTVIRQWIAAGAQWPENIQLHEQSKADRSWWSLQPLAEFDPDASIDGFIRAKLAENELAMNPPADRRSLIRRCVAEVGSRLDENRRMPGRFTVRNSGAAISAECSTTHTSIAARQARARCLRRLGNQ